MARRGLEEFAECLLVGLLIALASVPLFTAAPAFTAGCRVLRRSAEGSYRPLWTSFWTDFRRMARGGIGFTAVVLGLVILFAFELVLAPAVPGTKIVVPALGGLVAFTAVVALRTCAVIAEREGIWRRAFLDAVRATVAWPFDGLLLAAAITVAGVLVWMQPVLVLVVGGPLALAAVATGPRR